MSTVSRCIWRKFLKRILHDRLTNNVKKTVQLFYLFLTDGLNIINKAVDLSFKPLLISFEEISKILLYIFLFKMSGELKTQTQ